MSSPLVFLVTGASSGIGEAIARDLARRGHHVVVCARRIERLQELVRDLQRMGNKAAATLCDVTREGDSEKAVEFAIQTFGRLDGIIANAGFGVVGSVNKLNTEDYHRQFETNVYGVVRSVRAALPEIQKNKGYIGIVSSVTGFISLPGTAPYSMSKFAVRAYAEALYFEMRPLGVSVTAIYPGFVDSEIRQVDNSGQRIDTVQDPIPHWLRMRTEVAGRQIVKATLRRKPEKIITLHGKVFVFLERHFHSVIRLLINLGIRGRPEATQVQP